MVKISKLKGEIFGSMVNLFFLHKKKFQIFNMVAEELSEEVKVRDYLKKKYGPNRQA